MEIEGAKPHVALKLVTEKMLLMARQMNEVVYDPFLDDEPGAEIFVHMPPTPHPFPPHRAFLPPFLPPGSFLP